MRAGLTGTSGSLRRRARVLTSSALLLLAAVVGCAPNVGQVFNLPSLVKNIVRLKA